MPTGSQARRFAAARRAPRSARARLAEAHRPHLAEVGPEDRRPDGQPEPFEPADRLVVAVARQTLERQIAVGHVGVEPGEVADAEEHPGGEARVAASLA